MKLTPELLLNAYCQGIFPMADEDDNILWYDPDPRAVLPINQFHVPRSLRKVFRQGRFEIHFNRSFSEVIKECAAPGPGRETTWINEEIIQSYTALHALGFAHCVEAWCNNELVGGLYGVAINGFFAGESMFSRVQDASKVVLVTLVLHLRQQNFRLLDVQFLTEHLKRFGAVEIPRFEYHIKLNRAIRAPTKFGGNSG